MFQPLPADLRPLVFAECELVLDLLHQLQSCYPIDVESIIILLCINDATMRPFMQDADAASEYFLPERLPEDVRGGISRIMIADKTGLPRETVRRKCQNRLKHGYIEIDWDNCLRARPDLRNAGLQRLIETGHQAVRYLIRLRSLGIAADY